IQLSLLLLTVIPRINATGTLPAYERECMDGINRLNPGYKTIRCERSFWGENGQNWISDGHQSVQSKEEKELTGLLCVFANATRLIVHCSGSKCDEEMSLSDAISVCKVKKDREDIAKEPKMEFRKDEKSSAQLYGLAIGIPIIVLLLAAGICFGFVKFLT
ncbi:hypothetical protein PFISCL1PPCAC_18283, partial [Pristionchus fissidentatus]